MTGRKDGEKDGYSGSAGDTVKPVKSPLKKGKMIVTNSNLEPKKT